MRKKEKEMRER
ncbi:hypothetical protein L345_18484 [Ophiophagus hannah]|uniref:Uncharacterized protein n=1 Tax=Ophiophagus hannah TaxID=8665 RepID=V8N2M0_OPHHA|nr:hypothetical protein L345_18484 [Ophiophagus hannah]